MTLNRANIKNDAYIFKVFYRLPLTSVFRVLLVNNDLYMYIIFSYLAVPYTVLVPKNIVYIHRVINMHCFYAKFETCVIKCLSAASQIRGGNPKE